MSSLTCVTLNADVGPHTNRQTGEKRFWPNSQDTPSCSQSTTTTAKAGTQSRLGPPVNPDHRPGIAAQSRPACNQRGKSVCSIITGTMAVQPADLDNLKFRRSKVDYCWVASITSCGPGRRSFTPPSSPTRALRRSSARPYRRPCAPKIYPRALSIMLCGNRIRYTCVDTSFRPPIECTQYLSVACSDWLAEIGIVPSVGLRGDSYDNTLAGTVDVAC